MRQVQNDASPHQVTIERWTEVLHRMSSLESNRDYTLRLLKRDLSQALTNDPMPNTIEVASPFCLLHRANEPASGLSRSSGFGSSDSIDLD